MARKKRRSRTRFATLWIAGVIVCGFGLNLWLALRPEALEERIRESLRQAFACRADFATFSVSWREGVELHGFRLSTGERGEEGVLKVKRVRLIPRWGRALLGDFQAALVILEGVEVHVRRRREGRWNLEEILRRDGGSTAVKSRLPDLRIEDCRIFYSDPFGAADTVRHEFHDLQLALTCDGGQGSGWNYSFSGRFQPDFARNAFVRGRLVSTDGGWGGEAHAKVFKVDLRSPFDRHLPPQAAERLRRLGLGGHLDVAAHLTLEAGGKVTIRSATASLVQGHATLEGFPFPVKALAGTLDVRGGEGKLKLTGRFGEGRLTGEFDLFFAPGSLELREWNGRLDLDSFVVDGRLGEFSRPELRVFFEQYRPRGKVGISVVVPRTTTVVPQGRDMMFSVRLLGTELAIRAFPYQLTDVWAQFVVEGGLLKILPGARARCGGGSVRLSTLEVEPRRGGAFRVELEVSGLALDERFREASPEVVRRVWDDLMPGGRVDATVLVYREATEPSASRGGPAPGRPVYLRVDARPVEGRIRSRFFPYAVEGIEGTVLLDTRERTLRLKGLAGRHGVNRVTCDGVVRFGAHSEMDIHLRSEDLTVDEDLIRALPHQKFFEKFNFDGHVKLDAHIFSRGAAVDVTIQGDISRVAFRHDDFPYPCDLVKGRVTVEGFRKITLSGLATVDFPDEEAGPRRAEESAGSPRERKAAFVLDGVIDCAEDSVKTDFDLRVRNLAVDDRLKTALPPKIAAFIRQIGLQGEFGGDVKGVLFVHGEDPGKNHLTYQASDVTTSGAAVDFGLELRSMKGVGNFEGGFGPGVPHYLEGDAVIRRVRFNRLWLEKGQVYFTFGRPHPLVQGVRRTDKLPPVPYVLPAEFKTRLVDSQVADTFQMSVTSRDLYGGAVDGFLYVDSGKEGEFRGDFVASDIQLSRAAKDVFGATGKKTAGQASGKVRFSGRVGDARSIEGEGEGDIVDARLAEVPLFSSVLSLLNSEGAYFSHLSLPFKIKEGRFWCRDLQMQSSIMSLNGGGWLDFQGKLALTMQPRFIEIRIPIVDELFFWLKKVLLEVEIDGTLAKPRVRYRTIGFPLTINSPDESEPAEATDTGTEGGGRAAGRKGGPKGD
ncbi:MAG: hypothetical protein O7J95_19065 [Planctomycetota bacterium]|nr:hypothetical protein [Planctomycetota bacterium]